MSTSSPDQVQNIEKLYGSNYETWKIHWSYLLEKGKIMGFSYGS